MSAQISKDSLSEPVTEESKMVEENGRRRPLLLVLSVDSGVEFPAASQGSVLKVPLNPLEPIIDDLWSGESSLG